MTEEVVHSTPPPNKLKTSLQVSTFLAQYWVNPSHIIFAPCLQHAPPFMTMALITLLCGASRQLLFGLGQCIFHGCTLDALPHGKCKCLLLWKCWCIHHGCMLDIFPHAFRKRLLFGKCWCILHSCKSWMHFSMIQLCCLLWHDPPASYGHRSFFSCILFFIETILVDRRKDCVITRGWW